MVNSHSLPETKRKFAPENGWLEDEVSFGGCHIFRCCVSFRKGNRVYINQTYRHIISLSLCDFAAMSHRSHSTR